MDNGITLDIFYDNELSQLDQISLEQLGVPVVIKLRQNT